MTRSIDRTKEVAAVDDNKFDLNWRDNVYIGVEYCENRQEVLNTLPKFQDMWTEVRASLTWPNMH